MSALGTFDEPSGGKRWVTRPWLPAAKLLQRKGMTMTEIADRLSLTRSAVVQALYWDVVNLRSE